MHLTRQFAEAGPRAWLAALDPRVPLVWVVALSCASVLVDSAVGLALLLLCAGCLAGGLRLPLRGWLWLGGGLLASVWGVVFAQALFYGGEPRTVLWQIVPAGRWAGVDWPGLQLTREGATYGLAQSARLTSVALAGASVALASGPDRLLAALVGLRLSSALSLLVSVALRSVPELLAQAQQIRTSARLRGYRWRWSVSTLRVEAGLLLALLAAAWRRANSLATALAVRGWSGAGGWTHYPPLRPRWRDLLAVWAAVLFVGWLALGKTLAALHWLESSPWPWLWQAGADL